MRRRANEREEPRAVVFVDSRKKNVVQRKKCASVLCGRWSCCKKRQSELALLLLRTQRARVASHLPSSVHLPHTLIVFYFARHILVSGHIFSGLPVRCPGSGAPPPPGPLRRWRHPHRSPPAPPLRPPRRRAVTLSSGLRETAASRCALRIQKSVSDRLLDF